MYLKHMDIFPEEIRREPQHDFRSLDGHLYRDGGTFFQIGGGGNGGWGDGGLTSVLK